MVYFILVPHAGCWQANQVALCDVIHGQNGHQESWAIEAICRRLGYAGLKQDHKKVVRSFMNSHDVASFPGSPTREQNFGERGRAWDILSREKLHS